MCEPNLISNLSMMRIWIQDVCADDSWVSSTIVSQLLSATGLVISLATMAQNLDTSELCPYLDAMFDWNPKYGSEFNFHQRQVELYAKYDKDKLLFFLRSCNDISLQKALEVCEHYKRWKEMVYLLRRMGNPKAALELIINRLQDMQKAIDSATEGDYAEVWDFLDLSTSQPSCLGPRPPET